MTFQTVLKTLTVSRVPRRACYRQLTEFEKEELLDYGKLNFLFGKFSLCQEWMQEKRIVKITGKERARRMTENRCLRSLAFKDPFSTNRSLASVL